MKNKILGAIPRPYDNRDFNLGKIGTPIDTPERYVTNIDKVTPIWQNGWPACGSHAGAHMSKAIQKEEDYTGNFSPAYLWKKIKTLDGFPAENGTNMRTVLRALSTFGICEYFMLPNDYSQTLPEYTDPKKITPEMDENAQLNIISSAYAFLPAGFTLEELQNAIVKYKAVILLIYCDDDFFGKTVPTFTSKKYGHFVVAYGYDKKEAEIYILDSTEQDERNAKKKMMTAYFDFIREVGTAVDLSNQEIKELITKKNLLTKIVELYHRIIQLKADLKK